MPFGRCQRRVAAALAAAPAALVPATPAWADPPRLDLPASLTAVIDFRIVLTDGERAFADGGFGRSRFGGGGDGIDVHAVPAEAELVWHGPLAWNVEGTLAIAAQDEQDQPVDLIEAFATWRPVPRGATRFSVRAGLYWPQVSLEHEGPAWQVSDMITPSAINSWIGEEVKVVGLEGSASHPLAGGRLTATLGLFGFNDTAGALLAFRGWALHDQKTGAFSRQPLPPLGPDMAGAQPQWTTPTLEADHRPGFYGRLAYQLIAPVSVEAFYYDNRGDPFAVTPDLQWGWRTRFLNVGARVDLGAHTRLLAQALTGSTRMGADEPGADEVWVDTRFRSAFLRLTHEIGPVALSGRVDLFQTRQRGEYVYQDDSEDGWSLTGALDWRLTDQAQVIVEGLHVETERGARARIGLAPRQDQEVVQASMRITL
ncbi:MAG: hypothetical protein QOG13_3122 [Sphingomonadales bacterium]|jgi:hypothetical protein|nr:hypothetical protein [Sphingomonadales bacterium]